MPPTSDEQIRFLVQVQRLLDEGLFVATYKFALLLSLADIAIEYGDDSDATLVVSINAIAERFIRYYWRQAMPYPAAADARVLQQNTGRQAAVVNVVRRARATLGDSLAAAMNSGPAWKRLVRAVAEVVRVMPLWKLQTVGRERLDFLYANKGTGNTITLRPGVAFCFRKFHPMISDLVRGAWGRYVRQQNLDVLGETADLNEFLFGSERAALAVVRPVLLDIQRGRCFYCRAPLTPAATHVDHFIAWARYPVDPGHNFVLAHSRCNSQKRDRLPACEHLAAWAERNAQFGTEITSELERRGVIADLASSNRVTGWAYAQTEGVGGLTWLRADEMVPLAATWRDLIRS
jgi:5-methylcytosine-specific restriction endonuclease McrA